MTRLYFVYYQTPYVTNPHRRKNQSSKFAFDSTIWLNILVPLGLCLLLFL